MNPYEWPWENDPVESSDWTRVTTRIQKKVRKLSRRVSRMDREIRKMRKHMARLATAPAPLPTASELTRRLVGEAQRAAAAYTATRSAAAHKEAIRTRDALLEHVAALESGRQPVPTASPAPAPPPAPPPPAREEYRAVLSGPPSAEPPVPQTGPSAQSQAPAFQPPQPGSTTPLPQVPDTIYRWIRDAVSLLRVAGFANEGHVILRAQLTDQALGFMARRPAGDAPPTLRPDAEAERAPIGRPRLSAQRGSAGPPSMAARVMPRAPEPPVAPVRPAPPVGDEVYDDPWPARGAPAPERSPGSGYGEIPAVERSETVRHEPVGGPAMDSPGLDFPLADAPESAPAEFPAPDFRLYGIPEENESGEGEGRWATEQRNGEGLDTSIPESQGPDETGPRRWWSYAPVPPGSGE